MATLLELLAKGATIQEILEDYPELKADDLPFSLLYACNVVISEEIYDREVSGKYREMNYKLWTIFRLEPHYLEVFSCRASLR